MEPALAFLRARNVAVEFGHRLRAIVSTSDKVAALEFGEDKRALDARRRVILAVPPMVAAELVPGLKTPD